MSRGGQLIREARKRAGLTQRGAAERIGTTQSVVARWENDGAAPTLDRLIEVLRKLGYDLDYHLVDDDLSARQQVQQMLALGPAQRVARNNDWAAIAYRARDERQRQVLA